MTDLEALREALARHSESSWTPKYAAVLADAARKYLRLMEGAETVWWCLEHRTALTGWTIGPLPSGVRCYKASNFGLYDCRMVKADLHVRSESVEA